MNARNRNQGGPRGISFAAVLIVLQFAVVSVMLLMGQVDWQQTMATAPQAVGSAEASQGPADYAADVAGEVARGTVEPITAPAAAAVDSVGPVERVVPVGTAAAETAAVAIPHAPAATPQASAPSTPQAATPQAATPLAATPLAVVAADAAAGTPIRPVRLDPPVDAGAPATVDRMIAVDQSGIPLPPPAD